MLLGSDVSALSEEDVFSDLSYSLTLQYDSETQQSFSLKNIELVSVRPQKQILGEKYTVRIVSFKDEPLYETSFATNVEIFFSLPVSREEIPQKKQSSRTLIDLLLPYYPNAKAVMILQNKEVMVTIDLASLARCNENLVCDGSESMLTCPQDCVATTGAREPEGLFAARTMIVLGFFVVAVVLAAFCVFFFKKRSRTNEMKERKKKK